VYCGSYDATIATSGDGFINNKTIAYFTYKISIGISYQALMIVFITIAITVAVY
jgi:hypothetical protein